MAPAAGEKHFRAVLTDELVREMRQLYSEGNTTYMTLAVEYDIGVHTAWAAVTGKTWRHVT